jgi:hypothetical protein
MKSQQRSEEVEFARILGRTQCLKDSEAMIHVDMDEIVAAFGPAEVKKLNKSRRLFWNFVHRKSFWDFNGRFSLWVDMPVNRWRWKNLDVEVSATGSQRDWEDFFTWAMNRIGSTSQFDERPVALNGARFVVVPVVPA